MDYIRNAELRSHLGLKIQDSSLKRRRWLTSGDVDSLPMGSWCVGRLLIWCILMLLCCMHACMDACTSLEIFGMDSFHLRTNNSSQFEYGISKILRQMHLATSKFETWETNTLSDEWNLSVIRKSDIQAYWSQLCRIGKQSEGILAGQWKIQGVATGSVLDLHGIPNFTKSQCGKELFYLLQFDFLIKVQ